MKLIAAVVDMFGGNTLLRKVGEAALRGETGEGGWLVIDAPGATDKEISLTIMEANLRGLVQGCDVSTCDSDYPEWRLSGPTGATQQFVRGTRFPNTVLRILGILGATALMILGILQGIAALVAFWKH